MRELGLTSKEQDLYDGIINSIDYWCFPENRQELIDMIDDLITELLYGDDYED